MPPPARGAAIQLGACGMIPANTIPASAPGVAVPVEARAVGGRGAYDAAMVRRLLPNVYEGWIVVGASALVVLLIGATFFYGFGTIFNEVIEEFGWSVAATSLAFSLRSEVGGIAAPFVGWAIDRLGVRRVLMAGILVTGGGVLAMSYIQNIWQFYAAMFVIALGGSASGGGSGIVAIATWFERRRALAMSLMTVGGGIGGVLVVGIAALVEAFGWRGALRLLALAMLTIGPLMAIDVRSRPPVHPQPMDGARARLPGEEETPVLNWGVPVRLVVRSRAFLLLTGALLALAFSTTAVVVHQVPYMEREIGVSKAVAGTSVAVFTITSIIGRLAVGILGDRYSKQWLMAGCGLLIAAGSLVLALADSYGEATIGIMLIAPGFGGSIPVRPAILADYFGTRSFGTINGIATLLSTSGSALGPWLVGLLVDVTGGYREGWLLVAAVGLLTVPFAVLASAPHALVERYRAEGTLELPSSLDAAGSPPLGH